MARIVGTDGNDLLVGTDGDDEIIGKRGHDTLFGLLGDDILRGGRGNDTLHGGEGNDRLNGGAGADIYVWAAGGGLDTIVSQGNDEGESSGASEDIVQIDGSFFDFNWEVSGKDLRVGVTDGSFDFTIDGGLTIKNFWTGGDSIDYMSADLGEFNSFYSPDGGEARLYISAVNGTNQGNFTELIYGTSGDDVVTSGGGFRDYLFGYDGDDILRVVNGTIGHFRGGNGNDILRGADQPDFLRGDAGNDLIDGGLNVDRVEYSNGPAQGVFVNLSSTDVTFDFSGMENVTIASGRAIDNWGDVDRLRSIEDVRGSNFDDIIIGSEVSNVIEARGGSDWLEGREGADELYGGAGDDTIIGGDGDDYMVGDDGADLFHGGDGDDTIEAGAGDDSMEGGGGADALWGGEGNDIIQGGDGNDVVNAEAGDDQVFGGDGDDILTVGTFSTTETNYVEGGAGNDQLQGGFGSDFHWGGSGNDLLIDGGEGSDVFMFKNLADEGDDRIEFFKAGNFPGRDQVDLTDFGFNTFEEAMSYATDTVDTAGDGGSALLFAFNNGTTLTLVDVGLAFMTEDNLII
jgi:Ca2+-binding RTX toxin-like protein